MIFLTTVELARAIIILIGSKQDKETLIQSKLGVFKLQLKSNPGFETWNYWQKSIIFSVSYDQITSN